MRGHVPDRPGVHVSELALLWAGDGEADEQGVVLIRGCFTIADLATLPPSDG